MNKSDGMKKNDEKPQKKFKSRGSHIKWVMGIELFKSKEKRRKSKILIKFYKEKIQNLSWVVVSLKYQKLSWCPHSYIMLPMYFVYVYYKYLKSLSLKLIRDFQDPFIDTEIFQNIVHNFFFKGNSSCRYKQHSIYL